MLAKLMLKPSNLLILDEPTNDLDVETLELLESLLVDYKGTLLLVSHDREFIDNVVTSSLFFEGDGNVAQFVGGYQDVHQWYANRKANSDAQNTSSEVTKHKSAPTIVKTTKSATKTTAKKLSYKEQRELEGLPKQLEILEDTLASLQQKVSQADFYSQDAFKTQPILDKLTQTESALEQTFARWEELESLQNNK
jgi:ATP-binding cassette subfamily F protein uup